MPGLQPESASEELGEPDREAEVPNAPGVLAQGIVEMQDARRKHRARRLAARRIARSRELVAGLRFKVPKVASRKAAGPFPGLFGVDGVVGRRRVVSEQLVAVLDAKERAELSQFSARILNEILEADLDGAICWDARLQRSPVLECAIPPLAGDETVARPTLRDPRGADVPSVAKNVNEAGARLGPVSLAVVSVELDADQRLPVPGIALLPHLVEETPDESVEVEGRIDLGAVVQVVSIRLEPFDVGCERHVTRVRREIPRPLEFADEGDLRMGAQHQREEGGAGPGRADDEDGFGCRSHRCGRRSQGRHKPSTERRPRGAGILRWTRGGTSSPRKRPDLPRRGVLVSSLQIGGRETAC